MKFKAYTGITWSVLELTGLLEDEDSHVYFEKFKKHLGLHPFHLTNLNAALNEILSSNLNSYDSDLKGFLLAYKNPKLLTPLGEIFYDTCFIHVDIEADFYIFRPEVGCSLKGIVNKKGLDHIGVLVHKAFNVSIPKPDNEEDWPGHDLEIGQEVRFTITLLDFTSKLPFIRGVLNANDYLQGCKLMQKSKKKSVSKHNVENIIDNSINTVSEKNVKHNKKQTFFATDSENTSDEDAAKVKKEVVQKKKSKKEIKQEELVEYSEKKKKDKKHSKKDKEVNESKPSLDIIEAENDYYVNHLSINGEVESYEDFKEPINSKNKIKKKLKIPSSQNSTDEDFQEPVDSKSNIKKKLKVSSSQSSIDDNLEEPIDSTSKVKKKIKVQSSQSSMDEHNNVKPETISKRLFVLDSKSHISKIKSEIRESSSEVEHVVEDSEVETKPRIKNSSVKRKILDDSDTSIAEYSPEKYMKGSKSPSKKSSKKIKTEEFHELNDTVTHNVNDDMQESPKKQHKKHKHSLKVEISESEIDTNIEESPVKKHSKKSSILDCEESFHNVKIKKEKVINDYGNIQEEDNMGINEVSQIDPELNYSSNYDVKEDDESGKKKRKKHSKRDLINTSKIKIEPGFEDVAIKIENPDYNDYEVTENAHVEEDGENVSVTNSPKKKNRQIDFNDGLNNEEINTESTMKHIRKKVKKEKHVMTDTSDVDDRSVCDAYVQNTEKRKKHSKNSPHKRLNADRGSETELEFDYRNVKVKTEFTDS